MQRRVSIHDFLRSDSICHQCEQMLVTWLIGAHGPMIEVRKR